MLDNDSIHIGVDVGASKTVVLVSQKDLISDELLILGVGQAPNHTGIKRGKILDLNSTIVSIQKACEQAQLMSGIEFNTASINIPGEIEPFNSYGIVTIARKDREVKMKDIERVIDQAQMINIKNDKSILHLFPQYFSLDEQNNIKDPIGMTGLRLQGYVHIITTSTNNINNTIKCFQRCAIKPTEGVFSGYASANAVLSSEDKEIGALVLDMGAGSIDIIGYKNGYPIVSQVISLGGDLITRDLSIGLKVTEQMAENIKKEYGVAFLDLVDPIQEIEIPENKTKDVKRISVEKIASIIEPRLEEMFLVVLKQLEMKDCHINQFGTIVLTGGVSIMKGIIELSERAFGLPTRLGTFSRLGGLVEKVDFPSFATVIGLCLGDSQDFSFQTKGRNFNQRESGNKNKMINKMKDFFKDMIG